MPGMSERLSALHSIEASSNVSANTGLIFSPHKTSHDTRRLRNQLCKFSSNVMTQPMGYCLQTRQGTPATCASHPQVGPCRTSDTYAWPSADSNGGPAQWAICYKARPRTSRISWFIRRGVLYALFRSFLGPFEHLGMSI